MTFKVIDILSSRSQNLYEFLRNVEYRGFQRRIEMPYDHFTAFADDKRYEAAGTVYQVQNWADTVNVMNELMARPEVISTSLWLLSYTHKYAGETVKDLYAAFFIPDPKNPDYGDLYTLGGSIGDPRGFKQNNLQRNWLDVRDAGQNDRIKREDAVKFINEKKPPFASEKDINWVEIITPKSCIKPIKDNDATFVDGHTPAVSYLEKNGINRHTINAYISRDLYANYWMKRPGLESVLSRLIQR